MPQRRLILVGGPNGAGKTTFALMDLARHGGVYLGADAIAAEIAPADPASAAIEAGRQFLLRFDQLLETEERIIVESTLAGKSLRNMIAAAADRGFLIEINFVFIDSDEMSLNRVRHRVRVGGHDVPEEDVRRRFLRTYANFWKLYRPLADDWMVYYNGGGNPVVVAAGVDDLLTVYRESLFVRFQQLVQGGSS